MTRKRGQDTRTPERPRPAGRGEDKLQLEKKLEKADARNDRRLKKSSKPARGVTGDQEPFAVTDRDRGPVGTRGRGKPGHSKPGRY